MEGHDVSRLGELVLAWLLTRVDGRGTRGDLSRALKSFIDHQWSSGEWSTRLEETLAALQAEGLVDPSGRKGLALTREGRSRALSALGVERLAKGTTWKQLKRTHLVARSLGLASTPDTLARLRDADGLRAVLVQKQLGLPAPGTRSLAQLRDALCWKALGVETERPFTLAAVQALLLGRVAQSSREVSAPQALQQLAARGVGARRMDPDNLRLAALRSWLFPVVEPAPAAAPPASPLPAEDNLHAFAERVLHAARTATNGRFGEDRVFISHIWRAMQGSGLDERTFKNQLLQANQKRLLSLSRADMVELMDPADVAASEIRHLGATFHFIAL